MSGIDISLSTSSSVIVGDALGEGVGCVGAMDTVGTTVGMDEATLVGLKLGELLGKALGLELGDVDGLPVGTMEGVLDGSRVG